jgi:hypothetical protein
LTAFVAALVVVWLQEPLAPSTLPLLQPVSLCSSALIQVRRFFLQDSQRIITTVTRVRQTKRSAESVNPALDGAERHGGISPPASKNVIQQQPTSGQAVADQ